MRAAIAAGLVALAGCAGVTDVVNTGPDTFLVASHGTMGWSSGGAQKAAAIQKASDYCKAVGKQLQLVTARDQRGRLRPDRGRRSGVPLRGTIAR